MLLLLGLDISGWMTGAGAIFVAGIIVMFLRKKGLILKVKQICNMMERVTEEIGEAFLATSDVFEKMDDAIDKDGKLVESSVKDVIKEGKEAVIEWKDVIVIIKPKKQ
jgi:hypothetical protein